MSEEQAGQLNPNATPREKMADFLGGYTIHLNGSEIFSVSEEMQEFYDDYKRRTLDQFDWILKEQLQSKSERIKVLEKALHKILDDRCDQPCHDMIAVEALKNTEVEK